MPKKETLHSLGRQDLSSDENEAFMNELIGGSDRASALIGCAGVDTALVWALRCKIILNDEDISEDCFYSQDAVMGSLSARTRAGLALGIFDIKFKNTLDAIRRIRNGFAHTMKPIGFDHELVARECRELPKLPHAEEDKLSHLSPSRKAYVRSCWYARWVLLGYAKENYKNKLDLIPVIAGLD